MPQQQISEMLSTQIMWTGPELVNGDLKCPVVNATTEVSGGAYRESHE